MTEEMLHYSIAEAVNFLVLDMRDHYVSEHGEFHEWSELIDDLFFMNCDINIEPIVEEMGGVLHPVALRYGLSSGITALQFQENSYYNIKYMAEESNVDVIEMTYDDSVRIYDKMIERIVKFLFDGK